MGGKNVYLGQTAERGTSCAVKFSNMHSLFGGTSRVVLSLQGANRTSGSIHGQLLMSYNSQWNGGKAIVLLNHFVLQPCLHFDACDWIEQAAVGILKVCQLSVLMFLRAVMLGWLHHVPTPSILHVSTEKATEHQWRSHDTATCVYLAPTAKVHRGCFSTGWRIKWLLTDTR